MTAVRTAETAASDGAFRGAGLVVVVLVVVVAVVDVAGDAAINNGRRMASTVPRMRLDCTRLVPAYT
jgi:hypothetical protein